MKQRSLVAKRALALAIAAVLVLVATFAFGQVQTAQAAADDRNNVETWAELEAAIAADDTSPITITADITAEKQIVIDKAVTIQGTNDAKIYRKAGDANWPVFQVNNGGNLTLGEGLTVSGKTVACNGIAPAVKEQSETYWKKYGTDTDFKGLKDGDRVILGYQDRGITKISGTEVVAVQDSEALVADANDTTKFTLKDGANADDYAFTLSGLTADGYAYFKTASGKFLGRPSGGDFDPVGLVDENGSGYLQVEHETNFGFKFTMAGSDITIAKYIFVLDTEPKFVIGSRPRLNNRGGGWAKEYFYVEQEEKYWTVEGYDDKFTTEQAAKDFANEHKTGSGGCDESSSNCGTYTYDSFNSGTPEAARGFFVQVDGGTATLAGATLTDFVADGTVHHVAPVAVNNGGTFNVESGSITHNSVGYTADNSYWDAPAYSFGDRAIGKEDETGTGTYNGAMNGWAKTETAGGIIYNNGSSGEISGGSISGNRGDTGGVLVQGQGNNEDDVNATKVDGETSKVRLTGGAIDNNLGVHHGGGMSVYNGAAVQMEAGTISNNFSWHKGGGVFVSEEVFGSMRAVDYYGEPARIKAGSAAFTMNGGTISGNVAVLRGGGINVTSDHVALLGGSILNNNARVLGGGVYVEGDSGRMYQLYVANGCISGNSALTVAEEGAATSGPSNTADGCSFDNTLATPNTDVTYVDGFWGEKGDGGGLWLCPLGGNATFAINETHNVIIGGNSASSNGTDIFVTNPRSGVGNGVNVVSLGANNDFTDQDTGAKLQPNTTYAGELKLINSVQACDGNLTIQGNSAPNGGGIGANGTVIFGEAQDTYRASAGLDLAKIWGSDRSKDPITLKLSVQVGSQKANLGTVVLDGVADNEGEAAEDFNENTALYESAPWVASIGLPLAVTMPDGSTAPLFTTSAGNPSDVTVLEAIYKSGEELSLAEWNLVIEETDASGKSMTYVLPSGNATLDNVEKAVETEVSYTDIDGNPLASAGTYSVNFSFSQDIANDNEPAIEKYVAKDVHKDIAIDEVYPYDILAYVPLTADSIQITDTLDNQLQFESTEAEVAATAVVKDTNDHTVNGTVAATSETKIAATAKIDGQTLTVDAADAKAARGKYIQITFNAKIKDGLVYSDLDLTPTVSDNGTVKGGADEHSGIVNDASYKIKTNNEWSSDYDSNEVTVKPKPEEPAIEKYVNKNVHSEIALNETFTYDIVAYVTRDADSTTIVDALNNQLEFVSAEGDVQVACLGETVDHTPNGSVAQTGTDITDKAKTTISGQNLVVVIDPANNYRGQWVKVTFDAKIKDGLTVSGLEYASIDKNNPVLTDEKHEGVPNNASYTIKVGNNPEAYSKSSNTVTVKPKEPEADKHEVKISKTDIVSGNEISGATIEVYSADGKLVDSWVSTNQTHVLSLQPGEYTMKEVAAPDGYNVVTTEIKFTVAENGSVTCNTATVDGNGSIEVIEGNHLVLANSASSLLSADASKVSKHWDDGGNNALRKNVVFDLYYSFNQEVWYPAQNKSIELTAKDAAEVDGMDTWAASFNNLPAVVDGQKAYYIAVERTDFSGQYVNGVSIEQLSGGAISISGDETEIIEIVSTEGDPNGMNATNHPFTPNTSVDISKQEVGGGPELPGAKLTVFKVDGNGNRTVVETWTSGNEPHKLSLEPGIYVLQEVTAPNGYEVAEEMTFRVNVDGTVELLQNGEWISVEDHIVMFDAPSTTPGTTKAPTTSKTPTRTGDAAGSTVALFSIMAMLAACTVGLASTRIRSSRKEK